MFGRNRSFRIEDRYRQFSPAAENDADRLLEKLALNDNRELAFGSEPIQ
jgi:hypothetical protein